MASRFDEVEPAQPIEIFALVNAYRADTHPNKVDVSVGAYRTNDAKPWVLPVVREAEMKISADESLNHEYLPQLGFETFSTAATRMLLGADNKAIAEKRACGVQCLSGTGALRVGADFLVRCAKFSRIYISQPSWENHRLVFSHAGFKDIGTYRYWDASKRSLDIDGLLEDLNNAPEDSVIVLHACAHNPTGMDPTVEQWKQIADVIEKKKHFPFFDCAYQGFASGDLAKDSFSVKYFAERGFELFCAQSFAKNFGLYNERAGNLTIITKKPESLVNIKAQIVLIVRGNYSNPPAHGARVVAHILNDPELFKEWEKCIKIMSGRIIEMRKILRAKLEELKTPGDWSHITTQIGMFSYTGLDETQSTALVKDYHIYLPKSGRMSLCGVNTNNVDYVAKAIYDVVTKYPSA